MLIDIHLKEAASQESIQCNASWTPILVFHRMLVNSASKYMTTST